MTGIAGFGIQLQRYPCFLYWVLPARSVRELYGVDHALGAHHIGHVGDCRPASRTQIQHLKK
jgi:hypothetical protein